MLLVGWSADWDLPTGGRYPMGIYFIYLVVPVLLLLGVLCALPRILLHGSKAIEMTPDELLFYTPRRTHRFPLRGLSLSHLGYDGQVPSGLPRLNFHQAGKVVTTLQASMLDGSAREIAESVNAAIKSARLSIAADSVEVEAVNKGTTDEGVL